MQLSPSSLTTTANQSDMGSDRETKDAMMGHCELQMIKPAAVLALLDTMRNLLHDKLTVIVSGLSELFLQWYAAST